MNTRLFEGSYTTLLCGFVLLGLLAGCPEEAPPAEESPPQAHFSATPTTGAPGLTVQFTDESEPGDGAITSWHWNFGDGTTSAEQHPAHAYPAAGVYMVALTVTNAMGEDTMVAPKLIAIEQAPDASPPLISLNGPAEVTISCGERWSDPGATATDDRDPAVAAKLAPDGSLIWTRTYADEDTNVWNVAATYDGGMIITTESQTWLDVGKDLYILKTDAEGNVPEPPEIPDTEGWMSRYRLPDSLISGPLTARPGGYAFTAVSRSSYVPESAWLVQTDEYGAPVRHDLLSTSEYLPAAMAADGTGGFIIAGTRHLSNVIEDRYVMRVDGSGTLQWNHTLQQLRYDGFNCLAPLGDGTFLVGGFHYDGGRRPRPHAIRITIGGEILWDRVYGDESGGVFRTATPLTDGAVLAGYRNREGSRNHYAVKMNNAGDLLWERIYPIGQVDEIQCSTAMDDGGFLFAGTTQPADSYAHLTVLIRTDSAGDPLWQQMYDLDRRPEAHAVLERFDGSILLALRDSRSSVTFYRANAAGEDPELLMEGTGRVSPSASLLPTPDGGILYNGWQWQDSYDSPSLVRLTPELITDRYFADYVLE